MPLVESLQEVHSIDDLGDKLIWQTAKEIQQSLQEIFSELLGSHSLLAVADTSFNDQVTSGESYLVTVTHLLLIIKWLIQLSQAIQCGHLNVESQQYIALILASRYREGIAENADKIANILGLDSLEEILELIPKAKTFTKESSEERSQAVLTEMNTSTGGLLCSTCLTLLVQATMSARPRVQVKSVLPALRKALVANQATKSHFCANITKKLISNVQMEARMYRNKCQQVIETMVGKTSHSADILRSLFQDY